MVVKINAIEVTEGRGPELEERFAKRAAEVEGMPGFLGFELLRPAKGETRYFVYTRWETEEDFRAWVERRVHPRARSGGQGQQGHRRPRLRAAGVRGRAARRAERLKARAPGRRGLLGRRAAGPASVDFLG